MKTFIFIGTGHEYDIVLASFEAHKVKGKLIWMNTTAALMGRNMSKAVIVLGAKHNLIVQAVINLSVKSIDCPINFWTVQDFIKMAEAGLA